MPDIEVSGHAIDRASLRCRKIWHETALNTEEGLHAWLMRMAKEARDSGVQIADGRVWHRGLMMVFMEGEEFPVLKTIMPKKNAPAATDENSMANVEDALEPDIDPDAHWGNNSQEGG